MQHTTQEPESVTISDRGSCVKQKSHNPAEGHRKRILDRYLENGIASLHSHEVIELLLTFVIPRKDTKPIARALIAHYKTIGTIFNTSFEQLAGTEGLGKRSAAIFPLIRDLIGLCLNEKYENQNVISHRRDVEEYLRFYFGQRRDEYVAALFLDNANHILRTETLAEGTVNQCVVYPRNVVEKALQCGAASVILAHNHPGGSANPSEADWLITERLSTVGKLLEIPLLDHIIICRQKVISLRELPRWPR